MTTGNKVSIICVCYNQERFVRDALLSAIQTGYPNKEIIVVDDHSTDRSVEVIKDVIKGYQDIHFIQMPENKGNCAAFNAGFHASKGDFLIDFAADDQLTHDSLQIGIERFASGNDSYGVVYGDVNYLAEDGQLAYRHSEKFPHNSMPEGDIYLELIKRYFVSSASMMIRRSVLEKLGGYDETLAYEDFDFWIRSSREFGYLYTKNIQVNKRLVRGSMSDRQFEKGSPQQLSTYRVCEKILELNKNKDEDEALRLRVKYEIRQSLLRLDLRLAQKYRGLLKRINKVSRVAYK